MGCKDCPDRHENCWDTCESYLKEKKKREIAKKNRKYYLYGTATSWSYDLGPVTRKKRHGRSK